MRGWSAAIACALLAIACTSLDGIAGGDASDASAATDAGAEAGDAGVADPDATGGGSFASDPGYVPCGGDRCSVPGNHCCLDRGDGGALVATCMPSSTDCDESSFACDESADCGDGMLCCGGVQRSGFRSFCSKGNGCALTQQCRTDAECTQDRRCMLMECVAGFPISACGPNPLCKEL